VRWGLVCGEDHDAFESSHRPEPPSKANSIQANPVETAPIESIVRWREPAAERATSAARISPPSRSTVSLLTLKRELETLLARNVGLTLGVRSLAGTLARSCAVCLPPKRKPRLSGAFFGADDGTRTHDLLHGKQTL
jgi:hypothetical protein